MGDEPEYPCPECQLGVLRQQRVAYLTRQGGQIVNVPDFPAWVCDVCGYCEYDSAALAELKVMLQGGRPPRRIPRRPRPSGESAYPHGNGARRRPG
jgi:YgiT-type zinc finger domain-containing protein